MTEDKQVKTEDKHVKELLEKVEKITKEKKLDLSSDEDLSIGIMNLISLEEHLFFTAQKTGKEMYYAMLNECRQMRKELLKRIIKEYEGEVWCISKHLLAGSMRLMEVGTKALGKNDHKTSKEMFDKSYQLYEMFWGINLGLIDSKKVDISLIDKESLKEKYTTAHVAPADEDKPGFWGKLSTALKKAIDCCKE